MSDPRQLISGVVGGVVGFFVGGPVGAFYGASIGLGAGMLLFPGQLPGQVGPRMEDIQRVDADPGAPIHIGWGKFVVPGYRMAVGEKQESSTTEEVGGKGGPSQDVTTYHYRQTIALGLCEGPIDGVSRIWENGKLVYDARPQEEEGWSNTPFGQADYEVLDAEWTSIRGEALWADIDWVALGYASGNPISAAGQAIMTKAITISTTPVVTVEQWSVVRAAALFSDIDWSSLGYTTYADRIAMSAAYGETFVLYLGDEEQLPDPTLEEEFGVGNVPGYRGLAYLVYPDRELRQDQGMRHPVFKIEIGKADPTPVPLLLAMGSKVGPSTNFMAYSLDGGETWNECVVPVAGQWFGAAYSPSLGYAIAVSSTGQVIKSLDGVTWEAMPGEDLTNGNWQAGCVRNADDSLFVVVGLGGTSGLRAATSPDGVTWTLRSTPTVGGATSWGIMRMHESGAIFAASFAGGIKNLIRSDDGGITWAHVATAFSSVQNVTDFAFREGTDYIHCVGMNNTGAPSSFISSDLGVTSWQSVAFNSGSTPTGQAVILDPDSGFVYAATLSQGIWRIPAGETNVTNDKWVQVYAAGNIGAASHGGWISQLQRGFFCTPSGGGFAVHRLVDGAWSTDSYPSLLPATARVRVAFLPFPVGG